MSSSMQLEKGNESNKRLKKGPWSADEDAKLEAYVRKNKGGNWNVVSKNTGLGRCGKSCRLRWLNHLNPYVTKGYFKKEEVAKFFELYNKFGGFKWSKMARELPGRSDNAIKNFWNARKRKHEKLGTSPFPQNRSHADGESNLTGSSGQEKNRNLIDFSNNHFLPKFDDHTMSTSNNMGSFEDADLIHIPMITNIPPFPNLDYSQSSVHSSENYADEKGKTAISLNNNFEADHGEIATDAYFDYDLFEKDNKKGKEPISFENHFEANHADVMNPNLWVYISELLDNDDDYNSHSIDANLLLDTYIEFYNEIYKQ